VAEEAELAILIVDISGFTGLCDRFQALGQEGIDLFTASVNRVFEALLGPIHAWGGDVIKSAPPAPPAPPAPHRPASFAPPASPPRATGLPTAVRRIAGPCCRRLPGWWVQPAALPAATAIAQL
jgi:hypothetical protein